MSDNEIRKIYEVCECGDMQAGWNRLSKYEKETVMSLPNFNEDIFKECTGISYL